jgi:hypothetical protein
LLHQTGRIQYSDLQAIAPEHYFKWVGFLRVYFLGSYKF